MLFIESIIGQKRDSHSSQREWPTGDVAGLSVLSAPTTHTQWPQAAPGAPGQAEGGPAGEAPGRGAAVGGILEGPGQK